MRQEFLLDNQPLAIDLDFKDGVARGKIGDQEIDLEVKTVGQNALSLLNASGGKTAYFAQDKDAIHIFIDGEKYLFRRPVKDSAAFGETEGALGGKGTVETPMPGTIIKFLVKEGDIVEEQQGLVIVEAMKMENELRSPLHGRVKKINFQPGDAVDLGQSIIDLEEIEQEA